MSASTSDLARALARVRTERRAHAAAVVAAVVVGLAAAWVHWLGLVLGGALVGLSSRTLPRALAGGLGFGLLALGAFVVSLGDAAPTVLETSPVAALTVGAGLGLSLLGSSIRGVV